MNLPPSVPRNRGNNCSQTSVFFCIVFAGAALTHTHFKTLAYLFAYVFVLNFIGQMIVRFGQLSEEFTHLPQRYENSLRLLLWRVFTFNPPCYISLIISGFILIYEECPESDLSMRLPFSFVCVMCYVYSHVVIDLHQSEVNDIINLEKLHGLDYGSSMAHNYFHGYLKMVLPDHGDENRGIKEKIGDYISKNALTEKEFPVARLFIIISSSMYTSSNLSDMSCNWMEPSGNLSPVIKNRAGIMERSYSNSVYRIKEPGSGPYEHTYVAAEGASPLQSLYEYSRSAGIKQVVSNSAFLKEVIALFYKTLLGIIEDTPEVKGRCELIYIDDKSCNGNGINVAKLILQRIEEILNQQQ